MSELVENLRGYVLPKNDVLGKDIIAAADEIERLQAKLNKLAALLPGKALEVYTNRPIPRTVVRNLIDSDKVKAILEANDD